MAKTDLKKQLYKEYSMCSGSQCRNCCNCQKGENSAVICTAFGDVNYVNCEWDPDGIACGLFNEPFAGLAPARRTIVETYGPKPKKKDMSEGQITIRSLL